MEASRRGKTKKRTSSSVNYEGSLTVFFDCKGVVHHEFLPQGCTVNTEFKVAFSSETYRIVEKPIMNFASAHTSLLVREFLAKDKTVIMP